MLEARCPQWNIDQSYFPLPFKQSIRVLHMSNINANTEVG